MFAAAILFGLACGNLGAHPSMLTFGLLGMGALAGGLAAAGASARFALASGWIPLLGIPATFVFC